MTEPDVPKRRRSGTPLIFPSFFLEFPSQASRLPVMSPVYGLFAFLGQTKVSIVRNDAMLTNVSE